MGLIYILFLVFAVFAACVNGTTNDDTSILISNQEPNHRYLMASNSVDATSEERTPSFSKLEPRGCQSSRDTLPEAGPCQ
ncbi:uncharacterized protein IUM83_02491 [Phytophthora cinnamomi]|uniref:uncharacterized protein n=1 Tax=Phytophthora cinnamomi TaxID=4785 RepID=UPI00355A1DD3|nr:hypothetical protein IUM83_02491 [Phytophthora cinnamomi]